jgi:acetyltransferase-like isoleucine patch superfamily enzyme
MAIINGLKRRHNMLNEYIIKIIEASVRRAKNPEFRFDSNITVSLLVSLVLSQFTFRLRGLKLIARGRLIKDLQLGVQVRFRNLKNIRFGAGIKLSDYVFLNGMGVGNITLGDGCSIGSYSRIIISTSYSNLGEFITFGANVAIGDFSYIGGAGGVSIGRDTIVGQYLSIHPENHIFTSAEIPIRFQGVTRQGIKIGKNVWIGSKVTILDGVNVGDGSIICAGAVLTAGVYPPRVVIGGCPAKVIRSR